MSASENNSTFKKPTEYKTDEVMNTIDQSVLLAQVLELNKSLQATIDRQTDTIAELTRELEWFRRNMFGKKSETAKRFNDQESPDFQQLSLFDSMSAEQKLMLGLTEEKTEEKITINSYKRTKTERKSKRTREELLANAAIGVGAIFVKLETCLVKRFGWAFVNLAVAVLAVVGGTVVSKYLDVLVAVV